MSLLWIFSCITPEDCLYFANCEAYRPHGLACGLAHQIVDHQGGSCGDGYDPAWNAPSTGVESAGNLGQPCPEGYSVRVLFDYGVGHTNGWAVCMTEAESLVPRTRDLPAGVACGLSNLESNDIGCEGYQPRLGECPPGYRFRWVIDRYADRMNEQCGWDEDGDLVVQGRILPFCELVEGCMGPDCPDYLTMDARRGLLCGLHNRNGGEGSSAPLDIAHQWDTWIERCGGYHEDISRLLDVMAESMDPPTCMGKSLVDGSCPEGMAMVCTSDWLADADNAWGIKPVENSLCWCDVEGQAQSLVP